MADATDSKSVEGNFMWVRLPPAAPSEKLSLTFRHCGGGVPKNVIFLGFQWQTRRTQNPLRATSCGFDSHQRHQQKNRAEAALSIRKLKISSFFLFKAPDENAGHFALALMRRKLFQERVKLIIITLSRPNATRIPLASWSRLNKV